MIFAGLALSNLTAALTTTGAILVALAVFPTIIATWRRQR